MSIITVDQTGVHDKHGIPIHKGDMIRVFHFAHHMRRRKMYLYFRVEFNSGCWVMLNERKRVEVQE